MSAQVATARMTIEEFLDWADARDDDGRYELDDGVVVAMAPERIVHIRAKGIVYTELTRAVAASGLPCEAFTEGAGVRIDANTSYQPDAVIQCGRSLTDGERFIDHPVVVVEILSPSTAYRDLGRKARNYFRVPSIAHYLIVDVDDRVVTHRWRGKGGVILSEDHTEGDLLLRPPGLSMGVTDLLPPVIEATA